ncbi:MAG: flagellar hook-basal body complex protein FliE [Bacteroidetes bacterium]|nr:flagellar hook-basal body complex protein FliE [Bacteroidota bacterium]MCW5895116.1 flagellar hook-basal body complex protein FliE [Bacteroidota bacterium]
MQELQLLPELSGTRSHNSVNKLLKETNTSFSDTLNQAVRDVNSLQGEAGKAVQRMVSGEETDIHNVMIAVEKAKTSFELLMEVRNKTIEAYREIMRMQV